MRALLVQPPLVQLNTPYPAVHYLEAFLKGMGHEARSEDHSIELYRLVFSQSGLSRVFADARASLGPDLGRAEAAAGAGAAPGDAKAAAGHGAGRGAPDPGAAAGRSARRGAISPEERRELERYLSYEGLYLEWIDGLVDFLAGGDPAFSHRLSSAAELPRGARAEAWLGASGGRIGPDEARGLATAILEDLADFIRFALDPDFGTVRYGERLARSRGSFDEVQAGLRESYALEAFYRPFLKESFAALAGPRAPEALLVSIPFPGCLLGALACAEEARRAFGPGLLVAFGGGYVSTELRSLADPRIFGYCDCLSFDSGYGSLASILEAAGSGAAEPLLYRTTRLEGGRITAVGFPEGPDKPAAASREIPPEEAKRFETLERRALASAFPDYGSADFSRYLRVLDSANPMHRLWSEAPWLKYHLAHGCYWKKCSFCDVELDYVANFQPAEVKTLAAAADRASARTGLYGLHFVDEAMPMGRLLAFARENRARAAAGKRPFHFWGNARFDASWTGERCELLAASGLVAVSGGVEIATEAGLAATDKGFDLAGLVRALVAMKRAGLLVHAYLIYGFPGQSREDIVDSAETLRQLFASGLVDSAFWHRFVLTRRSRMMAEWRAGGRPGLEPLDSGGLFAANDLEFAGEADYDRYAAPLEAALAAWMEGEELERPASSWFEGGRGGRPARGARSRGEAAPGGAAGLAAAPGKARDGAARDTPAPGPAPDLVEALIALAEESLDGAPLPLAGKAHWLAGRPLLSPAGEPGGPRGGPRKGEETTALRWAYRGELEELLLPEAAARRLAEALAGPAAGPEGAEASAFLQAAGLDPDSPRLAALRRSGLVFA